MPERSCRCSTLFHQRSIWLRTMAGSSTNKALRGASVSRDLLGAGYGSEELPSRKDADAASRRGFDLPFLRSSVGPVALRTRTAAC